MRRTRARSQLLHAPGGGARDVVRHLLAVQAQDARAARLALRARGVTDLDDTGLVVTWLMRGTLHLVAEEDLPFLHAVTAPTRMAANRRRLAQLGVPDPEARTRSLSLDAREPGDRVLPHLLMHLALQGKVVRTLAGTWRETSVPWFSREDALEELGRRYATAHAGCTARDLAKWAGIPLRDVRLPEGTGAEADEEPVGPRLLPMFDEYLLGWADRSFAVPEALRRAVAPGGGIIRASATVDGEVVGTWTAPGGRVRLDVPDPAVFAGEVRDVEAFLARAAGG